MRQRPCEGRYWRDSGGLPALADPRAAIACKSVKLPTPAAGSRSGRSDHALAVSWSQGREVPSVLAAGLQDPAAFTNNHNRVLIPLPVAIEEVSDAAVAIIAAVRFSAMRRDPVAAKVDRRWR